MKKVLLIVLILSLFVGCKEVGRSMKDLGSSFSGLDRVVEVYTLEGTLLKRYKGQLDIETNEYGNKIKFDLNGKRVIIYNAVVIVEEK